jgi:hypothetical protein
MERGESLLLGRTLVFLTNHCELRATGFAELYRCR